MMMMLTRYAKASTTQHYDTQETEMENVPGNLQVEIEAALEEEARTHTSEQPVVDGQEVMPRAMGREDGNALLPFRVRT